MDGRDRYTKDVDDGPLKGERLMRMERHKLSWPPPPLLPPPILAIN